MILHPALLIVLGGMILFGGCAKKKNLEDQLSTKPDTTAAEPVYTPPPVDSNAIRESEFQQDALNALRPIYFNYDSYMLSEESRNALAGIGAFCKKYSSVKLSVSGHCDERGSSEYNMALGQKRADEAKNFLAAYGVPASRISTVSWGEEKPADGGHDEQAWLKNRRDEFTQER